jgi:hypothetical protein
MKRRSFFTTIITAFAGLFAGMMANKGKYTMRMTTAPNKTYMDDLWTKPLTEQEIIDIYGKCSKEYEVAKEAFELSKRIAQKDSVTIYKTSGLGLTEKWTPPLSPNELKTCPECFFAGPAGNKECMACNHIYDSPNYKPPSYEDTCEASKGIGKRLALIMNELAKEYQLPKSIIKGKA